MSLDSFSRHISLTCLIDQSTLSVGFSTPQESKLCLATTLRDHCWQDILHVTAHHHSTSCFSRSKVFPPQLGLPAVIALSLIFFPPSGLLQMMEGITVLPYWLVKTLRMFQDCEFLGKVRTIFHSIDARNYFACRSQRGFISITILPAELLGWLRWRINRRTRASMRFRVSLVMLILWPLVGGAGLPLILSWQLFHFHCKHKLFKRSN